MNTLRYIPEAHSPPVSEPIAEQNIEALRARGEVGELFSEIYKAAIEEEPRLTDSKIWALGSETPGFGFLKYTGGGARHKDLSESGKYELVINTDDGIEHYERLLTVRRTSAEICAEKSGIEKNAITPVQLASFIFLHELGHIVDFIKNAPDKATHSERRKRDMDTLPIPGYNPAQLAQSLETSDGKKWFFANAKTLKKHFGVSSFYELLKLQETAYHSVETEDIPDQFAVRIMKKLGVA
jgi:hypothetical protein